MSTKHEYWTTLQYAQEAYDDLYEALANAVVREEDIYHTFYLCWQGAISAADIAYWSKECDESRKRLIEYRAKMKLIWNALSRTGGIPF